MESDGERRKSVCVTGGTGFIASHLIRALLQKGYYVTTTVRNPDDKERTKHLTHLEGAMERLKIFRADLLAENSFEEALQGCFAVFHTASPVVVPYDDRIKETLIEPAVKGTLNVLRSCCHCRDVKRVILTSSCSAIRYDYDASEKSPLDESHWSNLEYCQRFNLWYAYAKTVAEKEAWKFAKKNLIDMVAVNPSFVIGAPLSHEITSTLRLFLSILTGENEGVYPNARLGFVHIDDVVTAHILAMENEGASGRFICSAEIRHWRDIVEHLVRRYPCYPISRRCGKEEGNDVQHSVSTAKIKQLGLSRFKSLVEMFDDCVSGFREKGLLS